MGKPIVGYWDIRGLAEPIRYLLHYKQVDFEDKRYYIYNDDAWHKKDKLSLGLDFPNLPYYIEGDIKLTQSTTILRYLGEKYDLAGKTQEQKLRTSLAEQQILDFRTAFFRLCYDEKFETSKQEFLPKITLNMKYVEAFIGNRKYLAGDVLTYVDFMAFDLFDMLKYIAPRFLDDFPKSKAYQDRIQNLPELQKYFKSGVYKRWPIVGALGVFGGKGPEPQV